MNFLQRSISKGMKQDMGSPSATEYLKSKVEIFARKLRNRNLDHFLERHGRTFEDIASADEGVSMDRFLHKDSVTGGCAVISQATTATDESLAVSMAQLAELIADIARNVDGATQGLQTTIELVSGTYPTHYRIQPLVQETSEAQRDHRLGNDRQFVKSADPTKIGKADLTESAFSLGTSVDEFANAVDGLIRMSNNFSELVDQIKVNFYADSNALGAAETR